MPSSHSTMRMTAIVSSIVPLLGATGGAMASSISNGCATSPSVYLRVPVLTLMLVFGGVLLNAGGASAQDATTSPTTAPTTPPSTNEHPATSALKFLGGGALGLA